MKEKKTMATPNKSSRTILLLAFRTRERKFFTQSQLPLRLEYYRHLVPKKVADPCPRTPALWCEYEVINNSTMAITCRPSKKSCVALKDRPISKNEIKKKKIRLGMHPIIDRLGVFLFLFFLFCFFLWQKGWKMHQNLVLLGAFEKYY